MKSKICLLLLLVLVLTAGCSANTGGGTEAASDKLQVVTTIFPPCDFVKNIGGDRVEVTMLLKPGMESHSYEPTPKDIIKIMNCDLFLYAGGESDVWVEELLAGNDREVRSKALLDWVDPLEEEHAEGMQIKAHGHDHDHEEEQDHEGEADHDHENDSSEQHSHAVHLEEEEYDEHVWTSPKNAMVIVDEICSQLSELDPENAAFYRANADAYKEELKALDSAFEEVVAGASRKEVVFGDRFPLLYFVKTYGLEYYAAFPGCSMETEPSAATIAFLTEKVREDEIPVVFYLEMSNGKIADAIAEAAGAETAVFYSGHAITAADMANGENYLSLMYKNVETLKKALQGE